MEYKMITKSNVEILVGLSRELLNFLENDHLRNWNCRIYEDKRDSFTGSYHPNGTCAIHNEWQKLNKQLKQMEYKL